MKSVVMTDTSPRIFLFVKDFIGRGDDRFFWVIDDQLVATTPRELVDYRGVMLCHDFWLVRDEIFDQSGDLPCCVVDLDEMRISISGDPDDRVSREKVNVAEELRQHGLSSESCSAYKKMFHRAVEMEPAIAVEVSRAMRRMYLHMVEIAKENDEERRYFDLEVPVYQVLQKAMANGVPIDTGRLSEMREDAEFDYFSCLKNYSARHDMPLETPSEAAIEARLFREGFDLTNVSLEYVLDFIPQANQFGPDTVELWDLDAARRVLSSLSLTTDRVRPLIDVFGSRTSRVQLRSPPLQNLPKRYRPIIAAREGRSLSYVDYDQYEVGIMAALSGDPELNRLYAAGDMYALFAREYLGMEDGRKAAKQLFLSYAYGMSRQALVDAAVELGVERGLAKAAFKRFAAYEEWKTSIATAFEREGRVATVFGNHFKRKRTGTLSAKERRSAVSQVVQGTASLIFKRAILEVAELPDVTITLPMHDALLFEHQSHRTPAQVVAAFESVMTKELDGRVKGKASVGHFVDPGQKPRDLTSSGTKRSV